MKFESLFLLKEAYFINGKFIPPKKLKPSEISKEPITIIKIGNDHIQNKVDE